MGKNVSTAVHPTAASLRVVLEAMPPDGVPHEVYIVDARTGATCTMARLIRRRHANGPDTYEIRLDFDEEAIHNGVRKGALPMRRVLTANPQGAPLRNDKEARADLDRLQQLADLARGEPEELDYVRQLCALLNRGVKADPATATKWRRRLVALTHGAA